MCIRDRASQSPSGKFAVSGQVANQSELTPSKMRCRFSDEEEISGMDEKANIAVAESVKFADESPFPNLEELHTEVYVKYE